MNVTIICFAGEAIVEQWYKEVEKFKFDDYQQGNFSCIFTISLCIYSLLEYSRSLLDKQLIVDFVKLFNFLRNV